MKNPPSTAAIFEFWRAAEMFSPQAVPRLAPTDSQKPVFPAEAESPLPWQSGHALKARRLPEGKTRRFFVFCGVFNQQRVRTILEERIGRDAEAFDERTDGDTCLCGFSVSDDGRPLFESLVVSSCAWALGNTLRYGPSDPAWLTGFDAAAKEMALDFENQFALAPEDSAGHSIAAKGFKVGRSASYSDLLNLTRRVAKALGLGSLDVMSDIRILCRSTEISRDHAAEDQDLLNSFFLKDLARVAHAARDHNIGAALRQYITEKPRVSDRVDVRASVHTLFQQLSPALFPAGRWPSKGHHPLVFSQQFAINSMVQDLAGGSGLFAVNGPPGTGKTTLLRDLIASVVVQRAQRLAGLARPEDAFRGEARWRSGTYTRVISLWREEFMGFEIAVASSNNGAVENISFEIPGIDAVDASWLAEEGYFRALGSRLLERPAWAMMSARLGNKKNRNEFVSKFWHGNPSAQSRAAGDSGDGFRKWLEMLEGQPFDWKAATAKFKAAQQLEQTLRGERQALYTACQAFADLRRALPELRSEAERLSGMEKRARQDAQRDQDAVRIAEANVRTSNERRLEHHRFRPGLLEIIFTLGRTFRTWIRKDQELALACGAASAEHAVWLRAQAVSRHSLEGAARAARAADHALKQKEAAFATVNLQLERGRAHLGKVFPDQYQWSADETGRELTSPWADAKWNAARARLFTAALELHQAFMRAVPTKIRKSLHAAVDVLSGSVPADAPQEAVQAAWTTLFFAVPVISTTFASFDRLFSHLGRESIGWLLIDEAGQAAPQAAAGAIWRARRAVIVGDPLQLEPVVPLPFTAQQALRRHYKVAETWLPGTTSVQQLADRVNRYGTVVKSGEEPIWVGSPLRVHRRCDRVMFEISNATAYDGLMVFGTGARPSITLAKSCWVHVESSDAHGHWIPDEGRAVEALLESIERGGVPREDVFLISPFRMVVDRLKQLVTAYPGVRAGTIHTVQGKEADVVVLVLGGDPAKPGAKKWASARPNLVNVAASRARRRLYVVGNKDEWRRYPYFGTAASLLAK